MDSKITSSSFQKIHFCRIIDFDYSNTGDIFSSPLMYTQDFFNNYSVITHNLSSVKYSHISKDDVVIIGGGGLVNYNPWFNFNVAINKILSKCDNVVLWGAGFNSKTAKNSEMDNYTPKVDFSRFSLYGIRDRGLKDFNFVPCASCMSPLLDEAYSAKPSRKIGTIFREDKTRNEDHLFVDGAENITHYNNYNTVIDFIADHEFIVTTSYHGALWASLANKKVIVPSSMKNGIKYNYFGFPVTFVDNVSNTSSLASAMERARSNPGILNEYRELSYKFFDKVKGLVKSTIKYPNKHYQYFYEQNQSAETYFQLKRKPKV